MSSRTEAALWYERMHRDRVSDDTRRAFEAWLEASSDHRAAYARVEDTWTALERGAESPAILAMRHEAALRLTRRTSRQLTPLRALVAALVLAAFALGVLGWVASPSLPRTLAAWVRQVWAGDTVYATATGERLAATLKDGSQVTLDTQSALEVAFTDTERLVRLKRGQAFFEVAKDGARPFVVEVHHRRLVAVGTAFDVRLDGEEIRVTMVEGTVRVEPAGTASGATNAVRTPVPHSASTQESGTARAERDLRAAPAAAVTTLSAGEQLTVDAEAREHVRLADADRATSWRRGQVIFDNTRLADAVAELNRYSETQIELADPALADLPLSGAFATGQRTGFIEAITAYFHLRVVRADEHVVVLGERE